MPIAFRPNQIALQDMATAAPGTVGWIVGNRGERARLVMIVTREVNGPPECLFVELGGDRPFAMRRIGNVARGIHFMLPLGEDSWSIELAESFRTAGGDGDIGSLLFAGDDVYLTVVHLGPHDDAERYFVRLSDFITDEGWPGATRGVIGAWKMVTGEGTSRTVLTESVEQVQA